jgi:hypothetical protein
MASILRRMPYAAVPAPPETTDPLWRETPPNQGASKKLAEREGFEPSIRLESA